MDILPHRAAVRAAPRPDSARSVSRPFGYGPLVLRWSGAICFALLAYSTITGAWLPILDYALDAVWLAALYGCFTLARFFWRRWQAENRPTAYTRETIPLDVTEALDRQAAYYERRLAQLQREAHQ